MMITRSWLESKLAELDAAGVDEIGYSPIPRNTMRAKMTVGSISDSGYTTIGINVGCVFSSDPKHENKIFTDSTPSGSLSLLIEKSKPASRFLEQGDVIYVDISIADRNPWNHFSQFPVNGSKIIATDDWENPTFMTNLTVRVNKKSDDRPTYADALDEAGSVVVCTYPEIKDCVYKYWRFDNTVVKTE